MFAALEAAVQICHCGVVCRSPSRAHLRRRDRPARDRAAVAIERAEKAISDLDPDSTGPLLTHATGEWAE